MIAFLFADINECALHPHICGVGYCINDQGKYHCECPEGYMAMPGGSKSAQFHKDSFLCSAFVGNYLLI